jgi:hypothetical protein
VVEAVAGLLAAVAGELQEAALAVREALEVLAAAAAEIQSLLLSWAGMAVLAGEQAAEALQAPQVLEAAVLTLVRTAAAAARWAARSLLGMALR